MAQIVPITIARERRQLTVEEAWAAYIEAKDRADFTRRIDDGIAAAKAWRLWLELFGGKVA